MPGLNGCWMRGASGFWMVSIDGKPSPYVPIELEFGITVAEVLQLVSELERLPRTPVN
jgi:hypothetical protein